MQSKYSKLAKNPKNHFFSSEGLTSLKHLLYIHYILVADKNISPIFRWLYLLCLDEKAYFGLPLVEIWGSQMQSRNFLQPLFWNHSKMPFSRWLRATKDNKLEMWAQLGKTCTHHIFILTTCTSEVPLYVQKILLCYLQNWFISNEGKPTLCSVRGGEQAVIGWGRIIRSVRPEDTLVFGLYTSFLHQTRGNICVISP